MKHASGGQRLLLTESELVVQLECPVCCSPRRAHFRVFCKSPFGELDPAMEKKHFGTTAFVKRRVRKLKASLERLNGVKRSA